MRIKNLSLAISFAIASITFSSCFDDPEEIVYSSDATITQFSFNEESNLDCKFTIDQINKKIYNIDSLQVGADTIIDEIKITYQSLGFVVSGEKDTIVNMNHPIDLSKSMNEPIILKVVAQTGKTNLYSLSVNVHQQEGDSLVMQKTNESFSSANISGKQKSIILNDKVFTYSNNQVYFSSDAKTWETKALNGLPLNIKVASFTSLNNKAYVITEDGKLFSSSNGLDWNMFASDKYFVSIVSTYNNKLSVIAKEGNENYFFASNEDVTSFDAKGAIVPNKFPSSNISSTNYKTKTNVPHTMILGEVAGLTENDTISTPWITADGLHYNELKAYSESNCCPVLEQPTIISYNNQFYAYDKSLNDIYVSIDGIVWKKTEKHFLFPKNIQGSDYYSSLVDKEHYIWIIKSKSNNYNDEAWKGRINKFGFIKQD